MTGDGRALTRQPERKIVTPLRNGERLDAAATAGYDVFVTTDRNLRYRQNLAERRIAIVVLGVGRWRLIRNKLAEIAAAVAGATPGTCNEVEIPDPLND
jgi:hypothetical protein